MNAAVPTAGDDAVTLIAVTEPAPGVCAIDWRAAFGATPVAVRVAASPDALAAAPAIETAAVHACTVRGLPADRRLYISLTPAGGAPLVVARRDLPFSGCVNFRDLGGYLCADGRRVRWGSLFRSGHMANLTADDLARFATLGIRTVCDFRVRDEIASESATLPGAPRQEVLGIVPGIGDRDYLQRIFASGAGPAAVLDAMHAIMESFVATAADKYRRMFELLLAHDGGSALINCSAGKERTGIGSALLLSALGVPRGTVMYDFMLSQRYFPAETEIPRVRQKYAVTVPGEAGRALIMPLLETRESYLQSVFDAIAREAGTIETWLATRCALGPGEIARLRERYTVAAA